MFWSVNLEKTVWFHRITGFYPPWKHQKTGYFLVFSGCIKARKALQHSVFTKFTYHLLISGDLTNFCHDIPLLLWIRYSAWATLPLNLRESVTHTVLINFKKGATESDRLPNNFNHGNKVINCFFRRYGYLHNLHLLVGKLALRDDLFMEKLMDKLRFNLCAFCWEQRVDTIESHSELTQTTQKELFAKKQPLTIFVKSSILYLTMFWIHLYQSKTYTAWKVSVFEVFLARIFPHLDWIRRDILYLSVFSLNAGKYGPEELRIRTLLK